MGFSFCLNKNDLLLIAGFSLLYQNLDLKEGGWLVRDNQRLVCSVIQMLERDLAPAATPFKKIACSLIAVARFAHGTTKRTSRKPLDNTIIPAPQTTARSSARKQLEAIASRFSLSNNHASKHTRSPNSHPSTVTTLSLGTYGLCAHHSSLSLSSTQRESVLKRANSDVRHTKSSSLPAVADVPNLDYLPFDSDVLPTTVNSEIEDDITSASDWEQLLGYVDGVGYVDSPQQPGVKLQTLDSYDSTSSGSASLDVSSPYKEVTPLAPGMAINDWSPEVWGIADDFSQHAATAQSVFSFTEESITSGEELSSSDFESGSRSGNGSEVKGILMPNLVDEDGFDDNLGL